MLVTSHNPNPLRMSVPQNHFTKISSNTK